LIESIFTVKLTRWIAEPLPVRGDEIRLAAYQFAVVRIP